MYPSLSQFLNYQMELIIITFSGDFVDSKLAGAYTVDCLVLSAHTIHAVFYIIQQL